jgi:hypothetical protein
MSDAFPAVGHKYLVDFRSATGARFRVQLDFASETCLTYTGIDANGIPSRTAPRRLSPRSSPFGTSCSSSPAGERRHHVVHLEDYKMNTIITNITEPSTDPKVAPAFSKFHGTMTQIS